MLFKENQICKQHADVIGAMRNIRNQYLTKREITADERLKYCLSAVKAAEVADKIDKPVIFEPQNKKIYRAFDDLAFPHYDPMQDRWWIDEVPDGKEHLTALRLITLQELRGAVSDKQDTFHVLQSLKIRFMGIDIEEKRKPDFISQSYGAIDLPEEDLGNVLRHFTKNRNLEPLVDVDRLVLRQTYDWCPDTGEAGIKQIEKLLEVAGKLGYAYIEFYLPPDISYSDLMLNYGKRLNSEQKNIDGKAKHVGWMATGVANGEGGPSRLLAVEHGMSLLTETVNQDELVDLNGAKFACFADPLGFIQRVVAAVQKTETYVVAFGLYLPKLGQTFEKSGEYALVAKLAGEIVKGNADFDTVYAHLAETGQKLGSTYSYAMIYTEDGNVESMDLENKQPKWSDF